ncbi:sensor histidine kinase [Saccharicrinis sp. FJH54]|uniref:sensor histidine kinase n=1 Tax=Saccharicrinis sp. FJH54 TaxID=3344665 RepID=UPI0035D3EE0B
MSRIDLFDLNELKRGKTLPFHLLFWVAVWFFYVYFFSYNSTDEVYVTWFSSGLLPVTMITTYLTIFKLIPEYLQKKRYGKFALYSFYLLIFTSYAIVLIIYACLILILKFNVTNMPPMSKNFTFVLILVYLVTGLVASANIVSRNSKMAALNKELENKILNTQLQLKEQELSYLKQQIQPHFLFNTLNTIYGFAIKQSTQTPDIILKLSNLLDYILYQVNKPAVRLKDEIEHIREYIELEEIRFSDVLEVSFETSKISEDTEIAPMMLIPFVENAFKHGSVIRNKHRISITVKMEDNALYFRVDNSFKPDHQTTGNGGIGIENIKKRLELNYKGAYHLDQFTESGLYTTILIIENINQMQQ